MMYNDDNDFMMMTILVMTGIATITVMVIKPTLITREHKKYTNFNHGPTYSIS